MVLNGSSFLSFKNKNLVHNLKAHESPSLYNPYKLSPAELSISKNCQDKIKHKINSGIRLITAVEDEITAISHKLAGKIGKRRFYNTAFKYKKRKKKENEFVGDLKQVETFNALREMLTDPHNDALRYATRAPEEEKELILTDAQIDEKFIILQTPTQRKILAESCTIHVDQNDKCTPKGAARTLTISARYKSNCVFVFKFTVENP